MTTAAFLADPHAILHLPRCISIARESVKGADVKKRKQVLALIDAAERADYNWYAGPSYHTDETAFDANVAAVNAAGVALLNAVGQEYT